MNRISLSIAACLAAAPLVLTGCAASNSIAEATGPSAEQATAHETVGIADGWAKSADRTGMTAIFGTLENHGSKILEVAGLTSDAAGVVELHEVTSAGVMQQITSVVEIPAGGQLFLAPGEDHIMLMDLTRPLLAGEQVTVTIEFTDGSNAELSVPVKDYSGANEEYGETHASQGDHDAHDTQDH